MPAPACLYEPLDEAACYRLLATVPYGRLVATSGALPLVVPVNFVLDGRAVVFRTACDGALAEATRGAVVAFQCDAVDVATRSGWSVAVTGVAQPVEDVSDVVRMEQLGIATWAPGVRNHYVRIAPGLVTGRYLLSSG